MTFNNRSFEAGAGTFFVVVAFPRGKAQVDGVFKTQRAANRLRDIIRGEENDHCAAEVRVGHFSSDGKTIETI